MTLKESTLQKDRRTVFNKPAPVPFYMTSREEQLVQSRQNMDQHKSRSLDMRCVERDANIVEEFKGSTDQSPPTKVTVTQQSSLRNLIGTDQSLRNLIPN